MNSKNVLPAFSLFLLALLLLQGCKKEPYMLGLVGYNYTDRAISDFSVNGQWGANLVLSTPTSGGGSTMCCVVMSRDTKTPFWVDVEYKMSALESYPPRKIIEPSAPYRKAKVQVTGPVPADPSYLEIHFYPDGHIEAALSGRDGPSPPRLKLERRLPFVR
ncbi:DUF3304 domain-containing protein [Paraburkholderia sacchari]|uniref:DUF3304 domain-containing protein n=1 Tax=Paraburkholderia sacchari TaxID=159450 RepID=A0A8T6ZCT8_9BURK|nr:DUF3304 domain-containing protein [Paraburkholderia sacchari]NLP62561.1 DUF3304 domain-containing protein [Paraburkholderia sacchari]